MTIDPELLKRLAAENRKILEDKKKLIASVRRASGELKPTRAAINKHRNA